MKIEQSDISFLSSHHKHHEIKEEENLHIWNSEEDTSERLQQRDRLELSENFKTMQQSKKIHGLEQEISEAALDPKLMSIVRALEALTGKKINISFIREGKTPDVEVSKSSEANSGPERLGWGIDYRYERTEINEEILDFSAAGSVTTEEGTQIDFTLAFSMQKSSVEHESIIFKAGDALIDPLVLNFGTDTVTMSNIRHTFDLDLDGKNDEFSFVGGGSGFLVLDKNGDGKVNDGSELFGPTRGNGFEELAVYDTDNNRWIDENDAVFDKLLIWTKDEHGNERLFSLKDKGVGALYLDRAATVFELEGSEGTQLGKMRESSIYLSENGGVGTVQEIDLKI